MKKILFTGFEPFGGESTNPSWEAVCRLPEQIGEVRIAKRRLPVEYDRVAVLLEQAIQEEQPDAVICVGQAGKRSVITPELVAINVKDAPSADNAGVTCAGEPVRAGGPAAYFATVPVREIVADMRAAGVPAALSFSAGAYVCNCAMYHLLDLLSGQTRIMGGFIHIPYSCSQVCEHSASAPSLPLETIIKGLTAAAETIGKGESSAYTFDCGQ